jgi:tetratricopeptide (TPR) repeat protein
MRRAYFSYARALHPDQLGDVPDEVRSRATEAFDRVRAAWEVLGDDAAREGYIARVIRGEKSADELAMERVRVILDAEADFKRALGNYHAGRTQEAHAVFQRVAEAVPDSLEFVCWAAFTRLKFPKDPAEAEAALALLHERVRDSETFDTGWVLLGMAMRTRGNDATARKCFVKALKIKPANPDAARELRRLEREGGDSPRPTESSAGGSFLGRLFGRKG